MHFPECSDTSSLHAVKIRSLDERDWQLTFSSLWSDADNNLKGREVTILQYMARIIQMTNNNYFVYLSELLEICFSYHSSRHFFN